MMQDDKSLLNKPMEEIKNLKMYQIQRLICQIAPIVQQSKKEAKKLGNKQRKIISFFSSNKKPKHQQEHSITNYLFKAEVLLVG